MPSKGGSTGFAPIHVRTTVVVTRNQKRIFFWGVILFLLFFVVARGIKIRMDATSLITPPNFEGIERKITYAKRKYHSGWM